MSYIREQTQIIVRFTEVYFMSWLSSRCVFAVNSKADTGEINWWSNKKHACIMADTKKKTQKNKERQNKAETKLKPKQGLN